MLGSAHFRKPLETAASVFGIAVSGALVSRPPLKDDGWVRMVASLLLTVGLAAAGLASADAATPPMPVLSLSNVSVKKTAPRDGYAGSVTVHMRFCMNVGPGARIETYEWRAIGARVVARARSIDPLGVDLDRVYPYECVPRYMISWIVPTRLIRSPGVYRVSMRLRDGYGRVTPTVSFSFRGN
jgi:hypothetical protein